VAESKIDSLDLKYSKLEQDLNIVERLSEKINELELYRKETEKEAIIKESYNKRLNILIHGVVEDSESAWENHQKTREKFDDFMLNALEIDPAKIEVADIHRIPQRPVILQRRKVGNQAHYRQIITCHR